MKDCRIKQLTYAVFPFGNCVLFLYRIFVSFWRGIQTVIFILFPVRVFFHQTSQTGCQLQFTYQRSWQSSISGWARCLRNTFLLKISNAQTAAASIRIMRFIVVISIFFGCFCTVYRRYGFLSFVCQSKRSCFLQRRLFRCSSSFLV